MSPYSKTSWVANVTPVTAVNMNHIEDGIAAIDRVPVALVRRGSNQTIVTSAAVLVSYDIEVVDTDNIFAPGTPTRLTIKTAGTYLVQMTGGWAGSAGGSIREMYVQLNGAGRIIDNTIVPNTAAQNHFASILWPFAAGDYLEVYVFQNTGGNLDLYTGLGFPTLSVAWISSP